MRTQTPPETLVGAFILGGALFTSVIRASTSHPAHMAGAASTAQQMQIYTEGADRETQDRQDAARRFRDSPWSQDDDFHSKESKRVKDFARAHDVSISSLLDALDEGMHEDWPIRAKTPPKPKVMPCRPRLMY